MTSRLRVFAGPNGSGKSTIKEIVASNYDLGYYVNADDIELEIKNNPFFDLKKFNINCSCFEFKEFFKNSTLLIKEKRAFFVEYINLFDSVVDFSLIAFDSYYASVLSDFIRNKLLETGSLFAFETVMSASQKIQFFQKAQEFGYRNYLYFVATKDYKINIQRVQERVNHGGHNVPHNKIIERYERSLDNLSGALRYFSRAYFYDNSKEKSIEVAVLHPNGLLKVNENIDEIPDWIYSYLIDKLAD